MIVCLTRYPKLMVIYTILPYVKLTHVSSVKCRCKSDTEDTGSYQDHPYWITPWSLHWCLWRLYRSREGLGSGWRTKTVYCTVISEVRGDPVCTAILLSSNIPGVILESRHCMLHSWCPLHSNGLLYFPWFLNIVQTAVRGNTVPLRTLWYV